MPIVKTPDDLGQILRARRKALGWDQAQLAKQVGVSRQWIIDIEKGKPRAEFGLVLRTINALGLLLHLDQGKTEAKEKASARQAAPNHSPPTNVDIDQIVDRGRRYLTLDQAIELAKQKPTDTADNLRNLMREQDPVAELAKQMSTGIPDDLRKLMRQQDSAAELARQMSTGIPQGRKQPKSKRKKPPSSGKSD